MAGRHGIAAWVGSLLLAGLVLASLVLGAAAVAQPANKAGTPPEPTPQGPVAMRRGNGADPRTLDPHRATAVPDTGILYDLFEGLVTRGAKGEILPGVAERWEVAEDGTLYTFHLRADAKWSNGDPVTAQDFVFSLRRALDRTIASELSELLLTIDHADEVLAGTRPAKDLGVEARGPDTLVIRLKVPTPTLLQRLAHPVAMPVNRASQDEFKDQWAEPGKLVTNGAYRLVERRVGKVVILEKNAHYHGAAGVKVDRVLYITTPNRASELRWFLSGELDTTSEVPADQVRKLAAAYPKEFWGKPYLGTYYYLFNLGREPFADAPALRQALVMALDRRELMEKVIQTGDDPAWGLVPPGLEGYANPTAHKELNPAERAEAARKQLKAAGYGPKRPITVELKFNRSENHKKVAEAIAALWQQTFGSDAITVLLVAEDWKTFIQSRDTSGFQLARGAWIGDTDDPTTFLDLFTSVPGTRNHAGYANPRFDHLVAKAAYTTDPAARLKVLEEAEKILLSDLPVLPIYHYRTRYMVSQRIKGWEWNIRDIHPTRFLSISR